MSAAEPALTGVVTRTSFYDGDVDQFVPKMTVQQGADGRMRLRVTQRAFRQGIRTRLEWPDGDPVRIFDGTSVAQFHYFPADTFFVPGPVVPVVGPPRSGHHPFDLPPRPTEAVTSPPLSVRRCTLEGREVLEKRWPAGPYAADRPGMRCLFNPVTGFLIRQTWDVPDADVIEWSDVHEVPALPDELFTWSGPGRSREEATLLHRQWRADGGVC